MTDENPAPPLGTPALHRSVSAARAVAGAASRIAPAPPPDQVEAPWANRREPRPVTQEDERRAEAVSERMGTKKPKAPARPSRAETKSERALFDNAYELVNAILMKWRRDVANHNIGFANSQLARELMKNGAVLIKAGYEIDKLASLIRLSNELVKNTIDEGDEDKRIDEFRKKMERLDMSDTVPENASAGEEEPPDEGDEENAD